MKNIIFVAVAILLIVNGANATTGDKYEGCLAYIKPVTLTGTVGTHAVQQ
jgi:hypothetical protein